MESNPDNDGTHRNYRTKRVRPGKRDGRVDERNQRSIGERGPPCMNVGRFEDLVLIRVRVTHVQNRGCGCAFFDHYRTRHRIGVVNVEARSAISTNVVVPAAAAEQW